MRYRASPIKVCPSPAGILGRKALEACFGYSTVQRKAAKVESRCAFAFEAFKQLLARVLPASAASCSSASSTVVDTPDHVIITIIPFVSGVPAEHTHASCYISSGVQYHSSRLGTGLGGSNRTTYCPKGSFGGKHMHDTSSAQSQGMLQYALHRAYDLRPMLATFADLRASQQLLDARMSARSQ